MELHCVVVIIFAGNCSKTKQPQKRGVFQEVFRTSIASVSLHLLDFVTIQPPAFITTLLSYARYQVSCNCVVIYGRLFQVNWDLGSQKRPLKVTLKLQWNLDLMKWQRTGESGSLYGGSFPYIKLTGLKNIVRYTRTSLYRGSLNRACTV